ncbi:hypothetical protein ACFSTC_56700 [Nonomuraea ferruginea]
MSMATNVVLALAAGFLAVGALGGGVVLLSLRRPWSKGLGLGLMIGWGLVSIVSAELVHGAQSGVVRLKADVNRRVPSCSSAKRERDDDTTAGRSRQARSGPGGADPKLP